MVLLAAVLRLVNLGTPHALVFDETYYVKDAWTLLNLGYEGQWPEGSDEQFNRGIVDGFTDAPAYIAHPPLGKWIIALGLQVFGAENPVGWRITTALIGVLAVALVCAIAWLLFRSSTLATLAGGLMAVDGLAITMSRTALLDNSLMLFCLVGFTAVLIDRQHASDRLAAWLARKTDAARSTDWGPTLWARPWLVVAGLMFGLATGVKWSGLYFLAFFGVYVLVVEALARRRAGVGLWLSSALLRQAPATFLLMVPIAVVAYVACWTGWLVTDGGYDRQWAANQADLGDAGTGGVVSWIPLPLQSLWHYHQAIYNTNLALESPHSYQANPLTWLIMARPTAFYYAGSEQGQNGCPWQGGCAEAVNSLANPAIWYLAIAAAVYLVYRLIRYREWRVGLILTGIAAGYLPWLLYTERTVFQFYTIVFLPYLVLGLTYAAEIVLGSASDPAPRRALGRRIVAVALIVIVALSVFFYSEWTGLQVPTVFQMMHYWFPGWV